LFNEVQLTEVVFETFVEGDGNLPENEGVCVDVFECVLLLVLDGVSEDADSLVVGDLDREKTTRVIAEHETIEIKGAGHGDRSLKASPMKKTKAR
jgi:hypothetical protein